jgi:hypothetical protein
MCAGPAGRLRPRRVRALVIPRHDLSPWPSARFVKRGCERVVQPVPTHVTVDSGAVMELAGEWLSTRRVPANAGSSQNAEGSCVAY